MLKKTLSIATMTFLLASAIPAFAQEEQKPQRSRMLTGAPVHTAIAGGGSLPQGRALTILNASFADRSNAKNGIDANPNAPTSVFNQVWLLKLRYGVTNHIEVNTTIPYINNKRSFNNAGSPAGASDHLEGFADTSLGVTFAPFNEHQGAPFSASIQLAALLPTGNYGPNHLPGNGVWGGRVQSGIGKWFYDRRLRLETEVVYQGPFERGNMKVKRGEEFQWNSQVRYLFNHFDVALESQLSVVDNGTTTRVTPGNPTGRKMNDKAGFTEWYVGPSANVAIDTLNMWAGVGVFFPVVQDYNGPARTDDVRIHFKIGKLW